MRYWYDSDNLSWTSNDGYEIWLDSDIKGYKLFSPNGFCLGVWFCDDLRKQIGDLDIKLYEYMFYKADRFLTGLDVKIENLLKKLELNSIYGIFVSNYNKSNCSKCIHNCVCITVAEGETDENCKYYLSDEEEMS